MNYLRRIYLFIWANKLQLRLVYAKYTKDDANLFDELKAIAQQVEKLEAYAHHYGIHPDGPR